MAPKLYYTGFLQGDEGRRALKTVARALEGRTSRRVSAIYDHADSAECLEISAPLRGLFSQRKIIVEGGVIHGVVSAVEYYSQAPNPPPLIKRMFSDIAKDIRFSLSMQLSGYHVSLENSEWKKPAKRILKDSWFHFARAAHLWLE